MRLNTNVSGWLLQVRWCGTSCLNTRSGIGCRSLRSTWSGACSAAPAASPCLGARPSWRTTWWPSTRQWPPSRCTSFNTIRVRCWSCYLKTGLYRWHGICKQCPNPEPWSTFSKIDTVSLMFNFVSSFFYSVPYRLHLIAIRVWLFFLLFSALSLGSSRFDSWVQFFE